MAAASKKVFSFSQIIGLSYDCQVNDLVRELIRGIRLHSEKLLSQLKDGDISRAQLGLGHAYSRSKVKFNVNRVDNMVTQSIALLDQLDKDVNTFAMRIRFVLELLISIENGMAGTFQNLLKLSMIMPCMRISSSLSKTNPI